MLHQLCIPGESERLEAFLSTLKADRGEEDDFSAVVDSRNSKRYTPLHTAIFNRNLAAVEILLNYGADLNVKCHGTPCLHLAAFTRMQPGGVTFGDECCKLLLERGANITLKDDHGYSIVHWAATFNLAALIECALSKYVSKDSIVNSSTKLTGITALHLAADSDAVQAATALLRYGADKSATTASLGLTAMHLAGLKGSQGVWKVLFDAGADWQSTVDHLGRSARDLAVSSGFEFGESDPSILLCTSSNTEAATSTAIVAHDHCSAHFTCAPSSADTTLAPPENIRRLEVLIDEQNGSLRSTDIADRLKWIPQDEIRQATLGDVLRVHEWSYIRHVQAQCEAIPSFDAEDESRGLGQLDGDTTISRGTFQAALAAAGAVCTAVDKVSKGEVRNAFCPVRPPGHHAGPRGIVKGEFAGSDSHGFCILNNISIGAAYAMNMYRDTVKKVAIVDFDVHHGNGTEETVRWLKPSVEQMDISSDVCFGVLQRPKYKPWFDQEDPQNVLFISVHGYGPRERLPAEYSNQMMAGRVPLFYPGSGETKFPDHLRVNRDEPANSVKATAGCKGNIESMDDQEANGLVGNSTAKEASTQNSDESSGDLEVSEAGDEEGDEDEDIYMSEMIAMDRSFQDSEGCEVGQTYQTMSRLQRMYSTHSQDAKGFNEAISRLGRSNGRYHSYGEDTTSNIPVACTSGDSAAKADSLPPLILDIGIGLPDQDPDSDPSLRALGGKGLCELSYRIQWRKYFREEIFPRLMEFSPDFIFISAGFDAHKKDTLNSGYIALIEDDFDWVTQHLVEIANSCCQGRIVSVLEGGYQLSGEYCSAFAQSAKAHVRALCLGSKISRTFAAEECIAETELEENHLRELERLRCEELKRREVARLKLLEERRAALAASNGNGIGSEGGSNGTSTNGDSASAGVDKSNTGETEVSLGVPIPTSSKKRRRPTVDYEALDRKLRQEGDSVPADT